MSGPFLYLLVLGVPIIFIVFVLFALANLYQDGEDNVGAHSGGCHLLRALTGIGMKSAHA